MNAWTCLIVNIAFRRQERADRRPLLGDGLIDAIRQRWDR